MALSAETTALISAIAGAVVPIILAYLQKSQKDEGTAYMDPNDTEVTKAPDYIPDSAFKMKPETEAEILAGRSQEEIQKILSEVRKQEEARVKAYTIKCEDGDVYEIEYGYILTRPKIEIDESDLAGTFDPREHPAEEAGLDKYGEWVRGLKMPDGRLKNMLHQHTPEDQASMTKQVQDAEAAGLRWYQVKFTGGYYTIENGIVIGNGNGRG